MNLFNQAVEKVKNVELITYQSESHQAIFESDLFKTVESIQSQGIGLRIIHNGSIGFSFSNDLDDENIINRAIESASFGEKAHFTFVNNQTFQNITLHTQHTESIGFNAMIPIGHQIIDKIKSELPDIKVDVGIEKSISEVTLQTSEGFTKSYKKSLFTLSTSGVLAHNDEILSIYNYKSDFSPILESDDIATPVIEKFHLANKKAQIKTGNYPVLFTPKAVRTLISIVAISLNGKKVQKGASPLTDRIGEQVLADNLTLIDDGTLEGGLASAPFDGEGSATQRTVLFEQGVLKSFIFDLQTAGILNCNTTGSASRSYSSQPTPGFRNIIVEPGTDTYDSLLSSVKEGVLVDQFLGAGQSNVSTGEFSMNLALGFKIEHGSLTGRLKDVMLSGNVFEVLLNQVIGLGNKQYREGSGFFPYILLDHLSISAKN